MLAGVLEVEGALPALRSLTIGFPLTPGVPAKLARALARGAAPALQHLNFQFLVENDEDLNPLADMVEARARLAGCCRLQTFEANKIWLEYGSLPTRTRLLRALLPSLHKLSPFTWNPAFDSCFIDTRPPCLETLRVYAVDDASVPSRGVLESVPLLSEFGIWHVNMNLGGDALQPLIAALCGGIGLQKLESIIFAGFDLNHVLFNVFLESLGGSACGEGLLRMSFEGCEIGVERMRVLAGLLRRDLLPSLEALLFYHCVGIEDEGVVALADALRDGKQTSLRELELESVRVCDVGIGALASVIRSGRMERLNNLMKASPTRLLR